MSFDIVYNNFARTLFVIALAAIAIALFKAITELFGFNIVSSLYSGGRLLELAATLLLFVIVVLLRQIRDELRSTGKGS